MARELPEQDDVLNEHHDAALEILRENDESRIPFLVYLRKFDIHNVHGPHAPYRRFAEADLFETLPDSARLIAVQETPLGEHLRTTYSRHVPALRLGGNDSWQDSLYPILERAEVIVSEFTFLSPGVRWELETCRALNKHHQTVLVIPPRSAPFECLDHMEPLDQFSRIVWADQFFHDSLAGSFVMRDLLQRLAAIGDIAESDRLGAYETGSIPSQFPIRYDEVLSGYRDRAVSWQVKASFAESRADLDYYRFWDSYRTASVVGVLVKDMKTMSMREAAPILTGAYIEVLQGIAHRVVPVGVEGSFVTLTMVERMAGSLAPLIELPPDNAERWFQHRYAQMTLERLGISAE